MLLFVVISKEMPIMCYLGAFTWMEWNEEIMEWKIVKKITWERRKSETIESEHEWAWISNGEDCGEDSEYMKWSIPFKTCISDF